MASAAIGVSHLVQATRAGALYGLALAALVVLAHAMKLPAMLAGPRYAAATGRSLLHAYRQQGRLCLATFAIIQVGTMFTIQAAVTLVTAALVGPLVVDPLLRGLGLAGEAATPLWVVAAGVLALCTGLLASGGYAWLDRAAKALMLVMAASTIAAAAIQLPGLSLASTPLLPQRYDLALLLFAVALVGWMPAPLDITVWHSLWSLARRGQTGHAATRRQGDLDFCIGFGLCLVLALAFLVLGAALLHGRDEAPTPQATPTAGAFAHQLIGLYTQSLGPWSSPLIATCAIAVMFSTTLTVLDAIPRALSALVVVATGGDESRASERGRWGYWAILLLLAGGAVLILARFTRSLSGMVDLATSLSFLGTALLAWFNHRAMASLAKPSDPSHPHDDPHQPARWLLHLGRLAIAFWTAFAALYVATWFV